MTVLGPIPDHVARALRRASEPHNAQRDESAEGPSADLPPDVRAGVNPPYTSIGGREIRGVLAGLADRDKIERIIREQAYAYQQRRIETNHATLDGGLAPTHSSSCACYSCWDARRREEQPAKGWAEHVRKHEGTVEVVAPKDAAAEETHRALGLNDAKSFHGTITVMPNRIGVPQDENPCGEVERAQTDRRLGDALKTALREQVREATRSRCKDCNGTGVLAGFGFGTSANAVDRPCHCSPPKDDGPSEWTQTRGRQVGADYHRELWTFTFRKGADERSFDVMAMHGLGTCVTVAGQADRCVVRINGEHCVDMAIARLLCGLRDGSITP